MAKLKVLHGGMFTTIQDGGRKGYQKFALSEAGAMDEYAYELANALVGNPRGEALLEMTYLGPMIQFDEDMWIALTGANLSPKVDGHPIALYQSHLIKAGSILSFGQVLEGLRCYLAIAGEIDVPRIGGSKSTDIRGALGGYHGRSLKKGDELRILLSNKKSEKMALEEKYIPKLEKSNHIHVVLGPQEDYFTEKALETFFGKQGYFLSSQLDRMGIRLEGELLEHRKEADIISDGTVLGAIQVPQNGLPIILMADRQTTGGYTKIGTVLREDLPKLAQMGPSDQVFFVQVSLEEAHRRYRAYENFLNEAIHGINRIEE